MNRTQTLFPLLAALCLLPGCNAMNRLSEVGGEPSLAAIQTPAVPNAVPVSLPMPTHEPDLHAPNSLWRAGARGFFKDQRAAQVGDILTVTIEIDDTAEIKNATSRSRSNSEDANADAFLGLEAELAKKLPQGIDPTNLIELGSSSNNSGEGQIARAEKIELKVAALVTQVLPNGNLVIQGRQEVRVNFEMRELLIAGVIRPQDVDNANVISYDKIAEARISYGGRGQISDVQQPRYGQQVFDILFPF